MKSTTLASLLTLLATALVAAPIELTTSRGTTISVEAHLPPGTGKVPALLIAPGQGYHMGLPLVRGLAEQASQRGIAAFRFNWSYFGKGKPSEDLKAELQDMRTALKYVMSHPRVRASQTFLAGKSLGTIVAYRLFRATPPVQGLALMTPVCSSRRAEDGTALDEPRGLGDEYYPDLLGGEQRPTLMVLGDKDPLCEVPELFDFLDDSSGKVAVGVFAGDHGMNVGPWNDPAFDGRNQRNRDAAHSMVLHHLDLWLDR